MVVLYFEVTGSRQTRAMLVGISMDAEVSIAYKSPSIVEFLSTLVQFPDDVATTLAAIADGNPAMVYLDRNNATDALEIRARMCTHPTAADYLYVESFARAMLDEAMADMPPSNRSTSYIVVDCGFDGRLKNDTSTFKAHVLDKHLATFTTLFIQTLSLDLHRQHRSTSGAVAIWTTVPVAALSATTTDNTNERPIVVSSEDATYFAALSSTFPYDAGDFHLVTLDALVPSAGHWTGRMTGTGDRVSFGGTEGIYRKSPHIQANVDFYYWTLFPDPIAYAGTVEYVNSYYFKDSWGWFRCFLGIGIGSNLMVNAIVAILVMANMYRRDRTVWLPDLYPSIQRRATIRAGLLFLDCIMGSWWYAHQSCMNQGNYRTGLMGTLALEDMTRADGIMVCLAITSIAADAVGVRIHLAVVVVVYMACFARRLDLINWCGIGVDDTNAFLARNFDDNIIDGNGGMNLWAMHDNSQTNFLLIATECTWLVVAVGCSLVYVVAAALVYRQKYDAMRAVSPPAVLPKRRPRHPCRRLKAFLTSPWDCRRHGYRTTHWTRRSTLYDELNEADRNDNTAFERSVGRIAADEVGLVAPTKDYMHMHTKQLFVSPSGVWLLGFVVVNDQYVVGINQYLFLVLNVLCQRRLFRIYALSLTGDLVSKRRQRLHYYDLTRANVWNVALKPLR